MEIKKKVTLNIIFVDDDAEEVKRFKDEHENISHNDIYLAGIDAILQKEKKT